MSKHTQKTKEDLEFVQIGDKKYDVESISERGVTIIEDIEKVDELIKFQQIQLSVSSLARGSLIERLSEETKNFTEV